MDDETKPDPRAVWLRSLGWRESAQGLWSGQVAAARFGRYAPMPIDHAYDVALRSSVFERRFRVEIREGRVRLASPWRELASDDLERFTDADEAR
jgi:hypothetical protein